MHLRFPSSVLVFGILFAWLGGAMEWAQAARPNVVVFLMDDLTFSDATPYGSREARTPNLQRLADAGLTFDRAFVASPSCAPSRAALLTGLMPVRNGVEPNHAKPRPEIKKLPAYFAELGYEIAAFGKVAHYNHNRDYGFEQTAFEGYHDYRGIPAAVDFLKERAGSDAKPLCLFVGTNWPHRPWPDVADAEDVAAVKIPANHLDTPETRAFRARYLTAVRKADDDLGTIYDAARATLGENTLFICSSDHGAQWPFGKWTCYEAGLRSLLIAAWPGVVKAGTRTDAMVSWTDFLPTLVEAAGGKPPVAGTGEGEIDGRSFLPVLRGERAEHHDRIFGTHAGDGKMNVYPMRTVRGGDWRYVRNLHPEFRFTTHIDRAVVPDEVAYFRSWEAAAAGGNARAAELVQRYHERPAEELYDLRADPKEQRNLATDPAYAERIEAARREMDGWMKAQGDEGKIFGTPTLLKPDAARATKPNIIVILTDDMGLGDLSCYGGKIEPTPNIDRLAGEGARFLRYYSASPICSPSRTGLLTGMVPARWNITSFLQTKKGNRGCEQADFLSPRAPTIPRRLKTVGYRTAHFGKWHLGGGRDVTNAPKFAAYGYDEHASTYESPEPHPDITATNWIWSDQDKVKRWDRTQFFVDKTLDFLRRHPNEPAFVNLWLDDPHTPWVPSADAPKGDKLENLKGVLAENDRQIGRLFEGLKELGVDDNTLVIFASDNGGLPTFGSRNLDLRGAKLSLYEGGIRLPFLARWPGKIPAGHVDETTILSGLDLFPTLAAIAGADLPKRVKFDGEDMSAALFGKPQTRKEPLVWEYGRNDEHFKFPRAEGARSPNVAIRDGRWKLLVNADGSGTELYDAQADPSETRNVAEMEKDVAERLKSRALNWRSSLPALPQ